MPARATVRTTVLVATAIAAAACSSGSTSAGSAPAPAPAASGAPAASAPMSKLPPGVTSAMVALGDSIFNNGTCQRCHGKGAVGATNAPSLIRTTWDHGSGSIADISKTIISGVPKDQMKDPSRPYAMRPRGGVVPALTDDQVTALAAYIYSLNHK